jgi:hypothetical protein
MALCALARRICRGLDATMSAFLVYDELTAKRHLHDRTFGQTADSSIWFY